MTQLITIIGAAAGLVTAVTALVHTLRTGRKVKGLAVPPGGGRR